jgi:hypothetical protein
MMHRDSVSDALMHSGIRVAADSLLLGVNNRRLFSTLPNLTRVYLTTIPPPPPLLDIGQTTQRRTNNAHDLTSLLSLSRLIPSFYSNKIDNARSHHFDDSFVSRNQWYDETNI